MTGAAQSRLRGRPVSKDLDDRLFEAVARLLEERRSFDDLTVEAICREAGASKASFYRRWRDRETFILHMMASLRTPPLPQGSTGSLRDDLVALLDGILGADQRRTRILHAALVAEGRRNRDLIERYMRHIVMPRRSAFLARLGEAVAAGELPADTDIEMLHELLTAPVLKVMLLVDPDQDPPENLTRRLVDQALRGGNS